MQTKLLQLILVVVLASDLNLALELPIPVFDKTAIYSEGIYKTLIGDEVTCHLQFSPTHEPDQFISKSILYLEKIESKEILKMVPIKTTESFIQIGTQNLSTSSRYSCCLEIEQVENQSYKKCSTLLISPEVSSDLTLVAKIIGLLEMLVLIMIFSLCLIVVMLRFKSKQKSKVIDAELKEITSIGTLNFGKPYLISPNAQAMHENERQSSDEENQLKRAKENFNIDLKTLSNLSESDFPPTYEETVLRRIEQQIESARY